MNRNQQSALFRVAKAQFWAVERISTADALIRLGMVEPVRIAIAPRKGRAVRITRAGRAYIREFENG